MRFYCPTCEPAADPLAEVLDVRWCPAHTPVTRGADDAAIADDEPGPSASEAGGEDNRRWCALLHRGRPVAATRRGRVDARARA